MWNSWICNLACIFNSASTVSNLTIIYGHGFSNIFQISNLNKDITATASSQATFARHVSDGPSWEQTQKSWSPLRRDPAYSSRLLSNATIGPLSMCIFPEKQEIKEKSRLATVLQ